MMPFFMHPLAKILFKAEQHSSHILLLLLKWNRSDLGTTSTVMSKLTRRKIALTEFQDPVLQVQS